MSTHSREANVRAATPSDCAASHTAGARPWTTRDVAKLTVFFATTQNKTLARMLSRSVESIESKAHDLGLRKADRARYPFSAMNVGDAIDIATPHIERVRAAAYGLAARHGRRYSVTTTDSGTAHVRRVA